MMSNNNNSSGSKRPPETDDESEALSKKSNINEGGTKCDDDFTLDETTLTEIIDRDKLDIFLQKINDEIDNANNKEDWLRLGGLRALATKKKEELMVAAAAMSGDETISRSFKKTFYDNNMETVLRKENQDLHDVEEILLNQKRKNENEEQIEDSSSVSKKRKAETPNQGEEKLCLTNINHVEVDDQKHTANTVLGDADLAAQMPTENQKTSENEWKQQQKTKKPPKDKAKEFEDHIAGLRNNTLEKFCQKITNDQAKAFGSALAGNTSLKKLRLCDPSLTVSSVQDICAGILQSQIEDIHLGGILNNNSDIRKFIFQTIQALPSLTTLAVQVQMEMDAVNGLCEALMKNKSIRDFSFEVTVFREAVKANKLARALMQSQIQKLRVDCRGFYCPTRENDDDIAILMILEAIQQLMTQSLVSLTILLDYRRPLMGVFTCLGNGLQHTTTLKELVVGYNGNFDIDSMRVLSQGLRQNASLTTLRFLTDRIDDDNVVVLAEHLHQDLPLETLELGVKKKFGTEGIGCSGALALVRAVAHLPTMQKLMLKSNRRIDHEDMRLIGAELPHLRLRELHLLFALNVEETTSILEDPQFQELKRASRQALLQGMKVNEHIQKLAICDMDYGSDFVDELDYYLDFNRWGRRLVTVDYGLPSTIWCYIIGRAGAKRSSKHVHSFVYYILREQPNLIQASW